MNAAAVLNELVLAATARGHLDECPRPFGVVAECDWCTWAVRTQELQQVVAIGVDAHLLASCSERDSVAAVVAYRELHEQLDMVDLDAIRIPAAQTAATEALAQTRAHLERLRRALEPSVAPGGSIEQLCRTTAGALTAISIRCGETVDLPLGIPDALMRQLLDTSMAVSEDLHVATLLPVIDHLHWRGVPRLATQPEWQRRPEPTAAAHLSAHQLTGAKVAAGSLESLVVEAVVDRCTDEFMELGAALSRVPCTRTIRQPRGGRWSSRTRATVWRRLRIDWHLTLIDTGLAACWNSRSQGDEVTVDVPWTVAAAIEVADRHGLGSATHQRPSE